MNDTSPRVHYIDCGRFTLEQARKVIDDVRRAWALSPAQDTQQARHARCSDGHDPVGFDLDATIEWRRKLEGDASLADVASAEHGQMADWLMELRNLRRFAFDVPVDRLAKVWNDQTAFMRLLVERRGFPQFPVDLRSKEGQRHVKTIAQDAMGELHEAIQHLKNAKLHRATDVPDFDRAAFLEELVDALKFLFEVAILAGVSLDEFFEAYEKKTALNKKRIEGSY